MLTSLKNQVRTVRAGGVSSLIELLRVGRIRRLLPALSESYPIQSTEVHILAGHDRIDMALWAIASWILATERSWPVVLHDDGTLRERDCLAIEAILPNCRVISDREAADRMTEALVRYPRCLQCRNLHPLGRKLFDANLLAQGDRFFSFDTDVLFFGPPKLLLDWVYRDDPEYVFLTDISDVSVISPSEFARSFGRPLYTKVNTGIIGAPRGAFSLDTLEECLRSTAILQSDRWFIEQTLYAVLASVTQRCTLLPPDYVMSLAPSCANGAIMRHYVGAVRHLLYSEGIPRVARRLESRARRAPEAKC